MNYNFKAIHWCVINNLWHGLSFLLTITKLHNLFCFMKCLKYVICMHFYSQHRSWLPTPKLHFRPLEIQSQQHSWQTLRSQLHPHWETYEMLQIRSECFTWIDKEISSLPPSFGRVPPVCLFHCTSFFIWLISRVSIHFCIFSCLLSLSSFLSFLSLILSHLDFTLEICEFHRIYCLPLILSFKVIFANVILSFCVNVISVVLLW